VPARRRAVRRADPLPAPAAAGGLVSADHGDRTWGTTTAPVGKQALATRGTIDPGGVAVTRLWAAAQGDWPVAGAPSPPAHDGAQGTQDPRFAPSGRVPAPWWRAVAATLPVRAAGLRQRTVGSVLARPPAPAWWHLDGTSGALAAVAAAASGGGPTSQGRGGRWRAPAGTAIPPPGGRWPWQGSRLDRRGRSARWSARPTPRPGPS
jgi:hypothetical protein